MSRDEGWSGLFASAFRQSRNAMALVDGQRRHVDVNGPYLTLLGYRKEALIGRHVGDFVEGGPRLSPREWERTLAAGRFDGVATMVRSDGSTVDVSWGGSAETITGRKLVLFVALQTGRRVRPQAAAGTPPPPDLTLSPRQRDVVRLVALGLTGPEIATELQIAHDTVRTHVRNAMTASGARSRAHLVAITLAGGHALA